MCDERRWCGATGACPELWKSDNEAWEREKFEGIGTGGGRTG